MSLKSRARLETSKAIRKNILIRPKNCQECKIEGEIHAHHPNYRKPLKVMWLCPKCHRAWHKKFGYQKDEGMILKIDLDIKLTEKLTSFAKKEHRTLPRQATFILRKFFKEQD